MIKVIIADDQKLFRESLKTIIEQDPEIEVVGLAGSGLEALELCEQFLPDVILMDVIMPDHDGIEGTKLVKSKFSEVKVLILTTFDDDQKIYQGLINGADGYLLKNLSPGELIYAIKNVALGFGVFCKKTQEIIVNCLISVDEMACTLELKDSINFRERDLKIIALITEGKNYKEIGVSLHLSEGRIKNIVSELLAKFNLRDRSQLVTLAFRNNLIK